MLTDSQRAALRRGIDVAALELLLSKLPAAEHDRILRFFSGKPFVIPQERANANSPTSAMLQPAFTDPELQLLFERISEPLNAKRRQERRAFFPQHWLNVERRFALIRIFDDKQPHSADASLIRRGEAQGGDAIILRIPQPDYRSVAIAVDRLMSAPSLSAHEEPCVDDINFTTDTSAPQLGDEGRRTIESLVSGLSNPIAPIQQIHGFGSGRQLDVWLLGSP
jgi:hypothetical protein